MAGSVTGRPGLGAAASILLLAAAAACSGPREPAVPTPENERMLQEAAAAEREGRLDEALHGYEAVLAAQPRLEAPRIRAADLARRTGDPEGAARHARRALERPPDDPADLCALVRALAPADAAGAAKALGPLQDAHPERADVRVAAAEVALARGDRSAAVADLRRALDAAPDAALLLDIGRGFSRAGFHSDAIETVRKSMAAGEPSPEARYTLAWVLEKAQRYDECVREYSSLIDDHPDYLPAYRNLGALMARDGELSRAIRLWERGLRYHPDDPGLRANIKQALDALGLKRKESDG